MKDTFVEDNVKYTRLMSRETLSRKDVAWLNEKGYSATIYPRLKKVMVNGFRKFRLI